VQFDWITITAQIANFLVLIWLLKRFLYAPITDAMARREERIATRLSQARLARAEAEHEAQVLSDSRKALKEAWEEELRKARQDAAALRKQLQDEARNEISQQREGWLAQAETERADTLHDIRLRLNKQVFTVVRRVLSDLADTKLTSQVANAFTRQLETLAPEQREKLADTIRKDDRAVVESGLDLPSATRSHITRAIHQNLADGAEVTYRLDRSLLLGIRLTIGQMTIEWSAGRHLEKLEKAASEAIEAEFAEARR